MKKKLIGVIFEDSRFGGPHSQYINLIENQNKIKFETLISKDESNHFKKLLIKNKNLFSAEDIKPLSINLIYIFKYILYFFNDIFKIVKFINSKNFNLIYIPGGSNSLKSVISCILSKKKFVWHIHDCHSNIVFILFFTLFHKFSKQIIFASKRSKIYYSKFVNNKKKFKVIQSSVPKINLKKIKKKNFRVGILANFNPIKNIELFIEIAQETYKLNKNIKFMISGNVWKSQIKYYKKCIKLIKKSVPKKTINVVANKNNVKKFFSNIDIYLCTSLYESSPLSLWEAMSVGKPIITTNVGDIKSFKNSGCTVINDNDISKFVKTIILFESDSKIYRKHSILSNKTYKKEFSINRYSKKILKILR